MKKISVILVLVCLMAGGIQAQSSKVTSAVQFFSLAEYDRALLAIDEATKNEKTMDDAKTWYYRGKIFNAIASDQTGKFSSLVKDPLDSALASFKKALALEGAKTYKENMLLDLNYIQMSYFNMGATAYSNKDYETAYKAFSGSAEANNLQFDIDANVTIDTGAIFNTGLTAQKIGKTDEAIATYQKLVDMQYKEAYLYQSLSDMYLEKGNKEMAQKVIEQGRKNFPKDESILITELNFYLSQGRAGEIVDKLNQAIALDPNNPELYFALGNSYGELMKLDSLKAGEYFKGAVAAYESAIRLKPQSFESNLNLGALYYNSVIELNKEMINLPLDAEKEYQKLEGERNALYKSALPYFEAAHAANAADIPTMQALKEIYAKTGNYDKMNEIKSLLGE